ncbi:hypothetical protein ABD624_05975 [Avibacterium paragallinarum]
MKFNFSFDIALFTTIFTIYLFVCGYFYYDGLISYYGFNQVSLGISIQDYLMYGWVNGMSGLVVGFLILLLAALVHTVYQNNLYEVMIKFIFVFITFILLFIFNLIFKRILVKLWQILLTIFIYTINSKIQKPLSVVGLFWISLGQFTLNIIKPAAKDAIDSSEKFHNFEVIEHSEKIDKIVQSGGIYYAYLVGYYILFFTFTFYVISIGKDARKEAENEFNSTKHNQIIIDDALITDWLEAKKLTITYPAKAKVIHCGTQKCLIALHTSNLKDANGLTLNTKQNYLIKLVNTESYVELK